MMIADREQWWWWWGEVPGKRARRVSSDISRAPTLRATPLRTRYEFAGAIHELNPVDFLTLRREVRLCNVTKGILSLCITLSKIMVSRYPCPKDLSLLFNTLVSIPEHLANILAYQVTMKP